MVMKRLLFLIVITAMGMFKGQSQALVQTYTDRCTGQTQVFSVPMNGSTVVAFYNRSKTFTSQDFQNGTLQSWLEETYLWWVSLNPCSTVTTGVVNTQQTTQQVTQQATQAATNAVATTQTPQINVSPPPTSPTPTQSTPEVSTPVVDTPTTDTSVPTTDSGPSVNTNESTPQTDTSGTTETSTGETGTTENTTEAPTTETSESQTETQQTESTTDDSGGNDSSTSETEDSSTTQDEGGGGSESTSEETTEETSSESEETQESEEQEVEESSEESSEEETTEEESSEEQSSEEEESESEDEESSKEESEEENEEESDESSSGDEEEDKKKRKKKRALSPPILTANILSQQDPTGKYTQAAMFGVSQSSLMGDKTYGLNAMVYSNLQQFMLTANYSKVHINKKGRISRVYSASIGGMKMFTTYMGTMNHSVVFLGKKGSVSGLALGTSITSVELDVRGGLVYYDEVILGSSLTGFFTKPVKINDKLSLSPMLAISSPFASVGLFRGKNKILFNKDIMFIGGSSFTYKLTQRFGLNLGINLIEATIKNFPLLKTFTIGSRLNF